MRWLKTLGCLVLLGALATGGAAWWAWSTLHRPYGEGEERLLVEPGTDAGTILSRLDARGVIADARLARAWLVYAQDDPPLHAGEYRFELPLTTLEVLDKMIRGDVILHRVTVIEGLTLDETAQALANAGFGELDAFLAAMRDPSPIADLDPVAENLEGYLFPETYSFVQGTSEQEIVAAMVEAFRSRFDQHVRPLLEGRLKTPGGEAPGAGVPEAPAADGEPPPAAAADEGLPDGTGETPGAPAAEDGDAESSDSGDQVLGDEIVEAETATPATPADVPKRPIDSGGGRERRWTVRELVTLASIVEKEAQVAAERDQVAAVYTNRLAAGMGLYADPTVIYALRLRGEYDGNLTRENLRVDSAYNTYRYAGLPPGPIASPGLGSLVAAADPADVPYLYFVSRNDGTHVFARTLAEHNRNVQRWQKEYWRKRWAEERRSRERESDSPPTD